MTTSTTTTKKPLEVSRLNISVPAFPWLEGKPYTVANVSLRSEPVDDRKHKRYGWDFAVTVELKCAVHVGTTPDGKPVKCAWDHPCCPQGLNSRTLVSGKHVRSHADGTTSWHTVHHLWVPYDKPSLVPSMPPSEGGPLPLHLLWRDVKEQAQRVAQELVAALVKERDERDAQEAAEKLIRRAKHIAEHLRSVANKRARKACDYDTRLKALQDDLATYGGQATASVLAEVAAEGIKDTEGERTPQDVVDLAVSLVKAQPRSTNSPWGDVDA
jgi:nucleotide-binding universal stress UspA family protein